MKIRKVLLGIIVIGLLISITLSAAYAFSFTLPKTQSGAVTNDQNQVIKDNHFVLGNNVFFMGEAQEDLFLFGQNVTFGGSVGRNLFSGAALTKIDGIIAGDLYVTGGNVEIGEKAVIEGDLVGFAGTLRIDGTVEGKVLAGVVSRRDAQGSQR